MEPEIVVALVDPLPTAGLAAIAVGFKEWRRRRETLGQDHKVLGEAADERVSYSSVTRRGRMRMP